MSCRYPFSHRHHERSGSLSNRSLDFKTFAPYRILAARGFPPGCVNLSTLAHEKARRAAEAAMPTTAAGSQEEALAFEKGAAATLRL